MIRLCARAAAYGSRCRRRRRGPGLSSGLQRRKPNRLDAASCDLPTWPVRACAAPYSDTKHMQQTAQPPAASGAGRFVEMASARREGVCNPHNRCVPADRARRRSGSRRRSGRGNEHAQGPPATRNPGPRQFPPTRGGAGDTPPPMAASASLHRDRERGFRRGAVRIRHRVRHRILPGYLRRAYQVVVRFPLQEA